MIDSHLRNYIQFIFDRIARVPIKLKINPAMLTLLSFISGAAGAFALYLNYRFAAVAFIVFSGILDILDGTVARLTDTASVKGALMDLVFDRIVEALVIFVFALLNPGHYIIYILFYISVVFNFSTFMAAGALLKNSGYKSMHYDTGLIERSETFIAFIAMIIFINYNHLILLFLTVLIFLTGIIRFIRIMLLPLEDNIEQ